MNLSSALDDGFGNATANKDVDNDGVFNKNEYLDAFFESFNLGNNSTVETKDIKPIVQSLVQTTTPSYYNEELYTTYIIFKSDEQEANPSTNITMKQNVTSPPSNHSRIDKIRLHDFTTTKLPTTEKLVTTTESIQSDHKMENIFNRSGTIVSTKSLPPFSTTSTTMITTTHSTTSSPNQTRTTTVKLDMNGDNFAHTNFGNIFLITIIILVQIVFLKF